MSRSNIGGITCAIACSVLSSGCGKRDASPTLDRTTAIASEPSPAAAARDTAPPHGFRRYEGDGFTMLYPLDGKVERHSDRVTISGTPVTEAGRSPERAGPGPHPTFWIDIRSVSNLKHVPLSAFMDSVRRRRNSVADSMAMLDAPVADSLGSISAMRFDLFCGDCEMREYYVSRGDRIVTIETEEGIDIAGDQEQQGRALRQELNTFRWKP